MPARDTLKPLFEPRSIAVVGASRRPGTIGHEIVRNLVNGGFTGPVYPVNPSARVVHSMHCHARVSEIPEPVDLAVIVVPAARVLAAARDCARKGVRGLVVISAGFAETGEGGRKRQVELLRLCRKAGMRLVGPNCMGILNTDPAVSMNATFAAATPRPGGAAFLSQSGALGEAILADARSLGLGLSQFASIGNRADVSPPDLLEAWGRDPRTRQILLYIESFGEPERFMEAARRVTREKPVMVVKSGRTPSGARAAISHTGSLAGSEAAVDSLLAQCGVLRVESMQDLFIHAAAVQGGRFPKGNRVAIVTNAGGPAILATDACVSEGLRLAELSLETRRRLRRALPAEASVQNPVDLIASADAGRFDTTLKAVLADRGVDMVLTIFVSPVMIPADEVARVIVGHARRVRKPVVACLLGKKGGEEGQEILRQADVPCYRFPEEAARALGGLRRLQLLHERPEERAPRLRVRKAEARRIVETALAEGRDLFRAEELDALLRAYGIPVAPSYVARSREEALVAAEELGWPVVLKILARGLEHKSDQGGVVLDVRGAEELLEAWRGLEQRFRRRHPQMRVLVQPMLRDGVELFFGAATDPWFGRMLAFGAGGIHIEVFKDIVFRLHPLSPGDARAMVSGIRAQALLDGVRGKPPVDREELVQILLRLDRLLKDVPELEELDLNPFLASWKPGRSCVLDSRARLRASSGGSRPPRRRRSS